MKNSYKAIFKFSSILLIVCLLYFIIVYIKGYKKTTVQFEYESLQVGYTNLDISLDIDDDFWKEIEAVKIHLFPQAARVPYGLEERDIWVRGIFNDLEIAFLLEFEDTTRNTALLEKSDACAIMFIPTKSVATAQMMGHASEANIWHWLAYRDVLKKAEERDSIPAVRELIAMGPGTQNPMKVEEVEGKGEFYNGRWRVIMKRQLETQQDGKLTFNEGQLKIAFAVWDGAKQESFGIKSISILRNLYLVRD